MTDEETGERSEQSSNKDQDSDVSSQKDQDEEIDKSEKEEDWIEFIKRSTKRSRRKYEKDENTLLDRTTQKNEVEDGTRIASLPEERWTSKIIEWNPGLDINIKSNRSVGREKDGKTT